MKTGSDTTLLQAKRAVQDQVAAEGLVPALNDTKWRELCMAIYATREFSPRFRIRDVLREDTSTWDTEWFHHPGPYFLIRWMDIDPDRNAAAVIAILKRYNVPFSQEGDYLRVWGYYSPSKPPNFES